MQEIQQMQEMQESAIDVNSQAAAVAAATGSESDTEPVSNVLEKQKPNENNDNEAGEADDGNGGEGEVENDAAVKVEGVMFVEGWWMYQLLGEGAFGEVRLLKNEKGECIAMKIVDLKKPNVDANDIRREMAIHKELKHKHILRLFGTREESTSNTVYMFLEFAEGGDLLNQIEPDIGIRDWKKAGRYFVQLVQAVKYLHSLGITHRDLKAENILLDRNDDVKLADFGCATVFRYRGVSRRLTNAVGTYSFMSPECFACSSHCQRMHNRVDSLAQSTLERTYEGPPADCWSLGVVLITMHFGEVPFHAACDCQKEYVDYRKGLFVNSPFSKLFSDEQVAKESWSDLQKLASVVHGLLNVDIVGRMTIDGLEQTEWYRDRAEAANERERENELLIRVASESRKRALPTSMSQPNRKVSRFEQLAGGKEKRNEDSEPVRGTSNGCCSQPASFAQLVCSSQFVASQCSNNSQHAGNRTIVRLAPRMTRLQLQLSDQTAALNLVRESLLDAFGTFLAEPVDNRDSTEQCSRRFAVVCVDAMHDSVANVQLLRVEIVPTGSQRSSVEHSRVDSAVDKRIASGHEPIHFTVTPLAGCATRLNERDGATIKVANGNDSEEVWRRDSVTLLDFRRVRGDGLNFKRAFAVLRDTIMRRAKLALGKV